MYHVVYLIECVDPSVVKYHILFKDLDENLKVLDMIAPHGLMNPKFLPSNLRRRCSKFTFQDKML